MRDQLDAQPLDQSADIADLLGPHLPALLGRDPIGELSAEHREALAPRRILVTGAAGSIGRALSEWLSQVRPEALALLDNHEDSLFKLRQRLLAGGASPATRFIIADVRNQRRMEWVLDEVKPEVVFHLAAYKHVPLAEEWPEEYVAVNVVATWQLGLAAIKAGVRKMVYASTDKAVNPPSVYGATKRCVEILLRGLAPNSGGTQFTVARLVNVVGARGGVVETFARDILAGQPVRVTDPRMTRYWITFPEALFLLVSAACRDGSGNVLVPDAGQPVSVPEVARRIHRMLRGPDAECAISYTGIRPGERLHEELAYAGERLRPTRSPGILEAVRDDWAGEPTRDELEEEVALLKRLAESGQVERLRERLFAFVKKYS